MSRRAGRNERERECMRNGVVVRWKVQLPRLVVERPVLSRARQKAGGVRHRTSRSAGVRAGRAGKEGKREKGRAELEETHRRVETRLAR